MILQESPNNIYFIIEFRSEQDYSNDSLNLLYGMCPNCIQCKETFLQNFNEDEIIKFERNNNLSFYKDGKKIRWEDIPYNRSVSIIKDEYSAIINSELSSLNKY